VSSALGEIKEGIARSLGRLDCAAASGVSTEIELKAGTANYKSGSSTSPVDKEKRAVGHVVRVWIPWPKC
jgi:hypothetical protein